MNSVLTFCVMAILCSAIGHPQNELTESERGQGCRPDDTTIQCSGRGICIQGECECEKRANFEEIISGKYCECDNFSCDRFQGLICGGCGTCECGICRCNAGWTGEDCTCRKSTDSCMPPEGGEVCSGHGQCVCGFCECDSTDEHQYSGKYCGGTKSA